jgi:hypothetical protein
MLDQGFEKTVPEQFLSSIKAGDAAVIGDSIINV